MRNIINKVINYFKSTNNNKLSEMIEEFMADKSKFSEGYSDFCNVVMKEFLEGNSKVYIPAADNATPDIRDGLKTISVREHEGKLTIWLFSSHKRLVEWAKRDCNYYELTSREVISIMEENNFEKVIIDNLFPISRQPADHSVTKVSKDTEIVIGMPSKPLPREIIQFYADQFKHISEVLGVYQYYLTTKNSSNKMSSLIIGIYAPQISNAGEQKTVAIIKEKLLPNVLVQWINDIGQVQTIESIGKEVVIYKSE